MSNTPNKKVKRVTHKPTSRQQQIRYAKRKKSLRRRRIRNRLIVLGGFVLILWAIISLVVHLLAPAPTPTTKKTTTTTDKSKYPAVTVCVDPGHGGYDGGNIMADGTSEKDVTLKYAKAFGKYLKEMNPNIKIVYTRTSDTVSWPEDEVEDLKERVKIADDANADYFISFHVNSNEDDSSLNSYDFYVRGNDDASIAIAKKIHQNIKKAGWNYDYLIQDVATYPLYVITEQKKRPSMLYEVGYGSNLAQAKALQKKKNINKIAKAAAKAYHDYILKNNS